MERVKGTPSQEILHFLLESGALLIAGQSPRFWTEVYKGNFQKMGFYKKQVRDTFRYLRNRNMVYFEKQGKQVFIRLTPEGEKKAGKFQINKVQIHKPEKWDRKWRLIIFDIPEKARIKREAFRGKLKELGFYQLQKSIWVFPYPCEKEVKLLREFFNLQPKHLRILEVGNIEEDGFLRAYFKI